MRVKYSDNHCVSGERNLGYDGYGNKVPTLTKNGKVEIFMKPVIAKDDYENRINEVHMWKNIATAESTWVWGTDGGGTKGVYEDWFVVPSGWFPSLTNVGENNERLTEAWEYTTSDVSPEFRVAYAPGSIQDAPGINQDGAGYWKDWDFAAIVKDDYMPDYDEYCNWSKGIDEDTKVPDLSASTGAKIQAYFMAHPELDPPEEFNDKDQFSIEYYDDHSGADPEDLHTPLVDYSGRTIHFINDAKYTTDLSEDWKNYWIKLKVKFKLDMPPGVPIPDNVRLVLYLYDPELDISGFDLPTNKYAVEAQKPYFSPYEPIENRKDNQPEERGPDTTWSGFDTRDIPKDTVIPEYDSELGQYIVGYNYSDFKPKYHRLDVSLNEIKDKIVTTSDGQELTVYFRTCRFGGNNYRVKGMIGIPTCFRWYELTKAAGPIEVWKKYPVTVTGVQLVKEETDKITWKQIIESESAWYDIIAPLVKGSFDDSFTWVYNIGDNRDLWVDYNERSKPLYESGFNPKYDQKWLQDRSDSFGFHSRSSEFNTKNNIHLILYPGELYFGINSTEVGGYTFPTGDDPLALVSTSEFSQLQLTAKNTWPYYMLAHPIIHEIGHVIGNLNHTPNPTLEELNNPGIQSSAISVMNIIDLSPPGLSISEYDKIRPKYKIILPNVSTPIEIPYKILWFHSPHNSLLRKGYYYWRSQP